MRALAQRMAEYIGRSPAAWIEGQITQLSIRNNTSTAFMTLRDPIGRHLYSGDLLQGGPRGAGRTRPRAPGWWCTAVSSSTHPADRCPSGWTPCSRSAWVSCWPDWSGSAGCWRPRGSPRRERKKNLPFLPGTIGLITARASARGIRRAGQRPRPLAGRAVPDREHSGAGPLCGSADGRGAGPAGRRSPGGRDRLARGGGSVEDLLPFSDETLCRAVSACRTPVVSAIGHEPDHPLDRRRSRPAVLHAHRRGQASGTRRGRRVAGRRPVAGSGPEGAARLGEHRSGAARAVHHGRRADRSAAQGPAERGGRRAIAGPRTVGDRPACSIERNGMSSSAGRN